MSFILTSEVSDCIVKVEDFNLSFPIDYRPHSNLRDKFIDIISSPVDYLFKTKDRLHVLKDINLVINKGDRVGILGINGAGKTTLCRAIAGMYQSGEGKIIVNGNIRPIFDTGVGLMPELTGRENARLLIRLIYGTQLNINQAVDEALEFSELGYFADTPFKTYSKGMQTRLFLSIAFLRPSDLILLDEVFDGADARFSQKITQKLKTIVDQSKAVIFVSHHESQIRAICNRLIILDKNELVFDGNLEEGLKYYSSLLEKMRS